MTDEEIETENKTEIDYAAERQKAYDNFVFESPTAKYLDWLERLVIFAAGSGAIGYGCWIVIESLLYNPNGIPETVSFVGIFAIIVLWIMFSVGLAAHVMFIYNQKKFYPPEPEEEDDSEDDESSDDPEDDTEDDAEDNTTDDTNDDTHEITRTTQLPENYEVEEAEGLK